MFGYFDIPRLTPQDINAIKADTERRQAQGILDLNSINAGANLVQNLSPMGNLGFLLGTVGGRLLNNYYDDQQAKKNSVAEQLGKILNSLFPQAQQNTTPDSQWTRLLDFSQNGEFFQNPTPKKPYSFSPPKMDTYFRDRINNSLLGW